jgi:ABC-type polysaccharide/polyol phosphate export permease
MGWLVTYNPFAACLELLRAPILDNHLPSAASVCVAMTGIGLLIAAATFAISRLESRLVYYL